MYYSFQIDKCYILNINEELINNEKQDDCKGAAQKNCGGMRQGGLRNIGRRLKNGRRVDFKKY